MMKSTSAMSSPRDIAHKKYVLMPVMLWLQLASRFMFALSVRLHFYLPMSGFLRTLFVPEVSIHTRAYRLLTTMTLLANCLFLHS